MIRIYKKSNIRIGFTLVEMVIVIGIIVILAAALLIKWVQILTTVRENCLNIISEVKRYEKICKN